MRLNDFRREAQRFEDIDKAVLQKLEAGTESSEPTRGTADGAADHRQRVPESNSTLPASVERHKCHLCDSTEHAYCGVCSQCGCPTAFVRSCLKCEDACYPGEECPKGGHHEPDETSEATCLFGCGSRHHAYDDDPTWMDGRSE